MSSRNHIHTIANSKNSPLIASKLIKTYYELNPHRETGIIDKKTSLTRKESLSIHAEPKYRSSDRHYSKI